MSQYASPSYAMALLEGGSDGRAYLLKERLHDRKQLLAALTAVAVGGSVVDPKIVDALIAARGAATGRRSASSRTRARDPQGDSAGQEQSGDRRRAGPHQAGRREAHQRGLPEARPVARPGGEPASEGRAHLPRAARRRRSAGRVSRPRESMTRPPSSIDAHHVRRDPRPLERLVLRPDEAKQQIEPLGRCRQPVRGPPVDGPRMLDPDRQRAVRPRS